MIQYIVYITLTPSLEVSERKCFGVKLTSLLDFLGYCERVASSGTCSHVPNVLAIEFWDQVRYMSTMPKDFLGHFFRV